MGIKHRLDRLVQHHSGTWATISQHLLRLASKLFRMSQSEAGTALDNNHSTFVYAGLPMLLAAVQSFIIEYEGMLNLEPLSEELSAPRGLAVLLESRYGVSGDLLDDLRILIELRNEIIHPIPLPTGTDDNWPDYLRSAKQKNLLSSTGNPKLDYVMFSQIASHKLFVWAIEITQKMYTAVVHSNPTKASYFQIYADENFKTLFG